jgi:hypothetical protein
MIVAYDEKIGKPIIHDELSNIILFKIHGGLTTDFKFFLRPSK